MRGFLPSILAAAIIVSTIDLIAPPVGLSVGAWPTPAPGASTLHVVDRTNKGDRLDTTNDITSKGDRLDATQTVLDRSDTPQLPTPIVMDCQPAFSPLIDPEHAQIYNSRCVVAAANSNRTQS